MPKTDVQKVTDDKINSGGILLKLYFDMHSKDKEKLQPLLVDLVNNRLLKEPGVVYCFGAIEEPLEIEGMFTTSATVTVLFENVRSAITMVFRYAPVGIEMMQPTKDMNLKPSEVQSILMDISQTASNYSKYILQNVMSDEQRTSLAKDIDSRTEEGKRHMQDGLSKP